VVSASARADAHSEYGTLVNPRFSALLRAPSAWTVRFSAGTGAFAPTPFTEQTEVTGLRPLRAFGGLRAERARSGSVDVGGAAGPFEINGTLFMSRITHAVIVRGIEGPPSELELLNGGQPVRTAGADALLRHRTERSTTTLSYAYTHATEQPPDGVGRRDVPLTPAHAAGLVSVWEQHGRWRVGFEIYYTGSQLLDDNPYRAESPGYVLFGLLGERRVGRARIFVNFENIGDVRMTKHHPLLRPTQGPGGRWTTDAWGPLEGRVINGGVRLDFGAGAGEGEPRDDGS
ncbi:MAG TPA: TonB-dependent receptor, partial [Gemmatimonadaceae bacterium]